MMRRVPNATAVERQVRRARWRARAGYGIATLLVAEVMGCADPPSSPGVASRPNPTRSTSAQQAAPPAYFVVTATFESIFLGGNGFLGIEYCGGTFYGRFGDLPCVTQVPPGMGGPAYQVSTASPGGSSVNYSGMTIQGSVGSNTATLTAASSLVYQNVRFGSPYGDAWSRSQNGRIDVFVLGPPGTAFDLVKSTSFAVSASKSGGAVCGNNSQGTLSANIGGISAHATKTSDNDANSVSGSVPISGTSSTSTVNYAGQTYSYAASVSEAGGVQHSAALCEDAVTGQTSARGTITVTVRSSQPPPQSPVARIGGPPTVSVNTLATFDGSGSSDSDGSIAGYRWSIATSNGTVTGSGSSISYAWPTPGTYQVSLTVTDDDGMTNTASHTVTVTQAQYVVTLSANPADGGGVSGAGTYNAGTSVTISATANAGYTFSSWTESGTVVAATPSFSFTATRGRTLVANFLPATCRASGTVSTRPGDTGPAAPNCCGGTFSAGLNPGRETPACMGPKAMINAPALAAVGEGVELDGSQSQPGTGGAITQYSWSIRTPRGSVTRTGPRVTHRWDEAGRYDATLTVTDASHRTGTARWEIAVTACGKPTIGAATPTEFHGAMPNGKLYDGLTLDIQLTSPSGNPECFLGDFIREKVVTDPNPSVTTCPRVDMIIEAANVVRAGRYRAQYSDVLGMEQRLTAESCNRVSIQRLSWQDRTRPDAPWLVIAESPITFRVVADGTAGTLFISWREFTTPVPYQLRANGTR